MLVGREAETAVLRARLDEARQGVSGVIVVGGDAGVGKTALLEELVHAAESDAGGVTVLRTTCAEAEAELPYCGLSDLLQPALQHLQAVPPAQAQALRAALALRPGSGRGDPWAVAAGALSLLAEAAGSSGLLAVVDDAQWLDDSSAQALHVVTRRLGVEGVLVVLAVRAGEGGASRFHDLPTLAVAELPEAESAALLRARAPRRPHPRVEQELVRATGGNPLALEHAAGQLTPAQLDGTEPIEHPVRVAATLERGYARQAALLSPDARSALLTAAASTTGDLAVIGRALETAGLSAEVLGEAEAARLVTVESGVVRFRHPLLRSAVHQAASPRERRRAHAALAAALADRGDAWAVERRATHLLAATVVADEEVAAAVEAAGRSAASRTSHARAFALLQQAARLSTDGTSRVRRLVAAADAAMPAGRPADAVAALDEALRDLPDPALRTALEDRRDRVLLWSSEPVAARARLTVRAETLAGADPALAADLLVQCALVSFVLRDPAGASAAVERAAALVAADREPHDDLLLLRAFALVQSGDLARGAPLLDACRDFLDRVDPLRPDQVLQIGGVCNLALDRPAEARRLLGRAVAAAREAGAVGLLVFQLTWLSAADLVLGAWDAAYAEASEAVHLAGEIGWRTQEPTCLTALARVEALTGRDSCSEHAARALAGCAPIGPAGAAGAGGPSGAGEPSGPGEPSGSGGSAGASSSAVTEVYAHSALGVLALGRGRAEDAVRSLGHALAAARTGGLGVLVELQVVPDLLEALARSERRDAALALLLELEAAAARTGRPSALAAAARCRGLLGAGEASESDFAEALHRHADSANPFERARTELCLGEHRRRRRARGSAREPLRSAADTFRRLGARDWLERAEAELRLAGEAPPAHEEAALDRLTAQELQVALAVADGGSNAEVAAGLFLSTKTVESHLTHVYRKLGVRSRTELGRELARGSPASARADGRAG